MSISSTQSILTNPAFFGEQAVKNGTAADRLTSSIPETHSPADSEDLKTAFQDFVGQTFFSELIKSMRATQQPAAYFHGGRAEEIFQGQLDQIFSEELSDSSADKIANPMFELFQLSRQR
ncbi:MAG: rod-binding protein [Planctomycetales bacterium]|nr:rod-binding protein [Planctomycetales bacterium]